MVPVYSFGYCVPMIDARRLKKRMEECGLSQAELARRVGVAQTSIFKLVSGRSYSSRHLHLIARELQTTPAYLTGETDDPTSDAPDEALSSQDREDVALLLKLSHEDRESIRRLMRSLSSESLIPADHAPTASATVHSPSRSFMGKNLSKGEAA